MDPFFPEEEEMLGYLHEFEIAMGRGNKGETSGGDDWMVKNIVEDIYWFINKNDEL